MSCSSTYRGFFYIAPGALRSMLCFPVKQHISWTAFWGAVNPGHLPTFCSQGAEK